jgi:ABC-type transport system substrate-binding protein
MNRKQPSSAGVALLFTLLLAMAALVACGGAAEPDTIIERVEVEVTRIVEGETITVVETVEVPVEVEREVEVTPAAAPGRATLIVALAAPPTSLDPADHRDRNSETVIRNMFDGLVTRDTRSDVHLELAEEMPHWLDDVTLEVKIREGVTFHNGERPHSRRRRVHL